MSKNLRNLNSGESVKLTKEMLESASYQFVTKAYKVITGKGNIIGKKKQDLIPELIGKTFVEPEKVVVEPKVATKVFKKQENTNAPTKVQKRLEDFKQVYRDKIESLKYHREASTLSKIVTPLKDVVEAAWNRDLATLLYFKPALSMGEKVIIHSDQSNVPFGYVRVQRTHEKCGKFTEVFSARNFRNLNEPDWSVVEQEAQRAFRNSLREHIDFTT